jgi:hypothetical protein
MFVIFYDIAIPLPTSIGLHPAPIRSGSYLAWKNHFFHSFTLLIIGFFVLIDYLEHSLNKLILSYKTASYSLNMNDKRLPLPL